MIKEILKRFNEKEDTTDKKEELIIKIMEGLKEFETEEGLLLMMEDNIRNMETLNEINIYLYYTLKELYLFEVSHPIEYLTGANKEIKSLTIEEVYLK